MSDETSSKSISTPMWDGKTETYSVYKDKLVAVATFHEIEDALDVSMMNTCPGLTQVRAIQAKAEANRDADEKKGLKLYQGNSKMCAIYTLGQDNKHGTKVLKATKSIEYPHGILANALVVLDKKYMPKDVTSKIEMKNRLASINFRKAVDYHTDMQDVCAEYEQIIPDSEMLEIMATKVSSLAFIAIIADELTKSPPSFSDACDEISRLQRLAGVNSKSGSEKGSGRGETSLNSTEGGSGSGNGGNGGDNKPCGFCNKKGHKKKDCNKRKEALKKQGKCPSCSKDSHLESECWTKNPNLAPKWWSKKSGNEAAGASGEISMMSLEMEVEDQHFA